MRSLDEAPEAQSAAMEKTVVAFVHVEPRTWRAVTTRRPIYLTLGMHFFAAPRSGSKTQVTKSPRRPTGISVTWSSAPQGIRLRGFTRSFRGRVIS
jgi:hypothetical protein